MSNIYPQSGRSSDSQSLTRSVAVLRFVADNPGASLGAIAKATSLPRSTVQRLVASLSGVGFVTKLFGQQGVYLGMELARLGAKVHLNPRSMLAPMLEDLHQRIGDNIDLTTIEQGKVIVIEQIASNEDIRVISYVGKQHPITCTANGKAHLGQMTNEELRAFLAQDLPCFTRNSISDRDTLIHQIEEFRRQGVFVDREEYSDGACAMAIALPEIGGKKLTISIAMPTARFVRRETEVREALMQFRQSVETAFGISI